MKYQDFLTHSLSGATKIAQSQFGKVTGTTKAGDNNQVLTEADLAIGKYLIAEITKYYPDHNIIDEEAGVIDNNSAYTWVVDPVDGTSNFAGGVPTYGILLGLLKEGTPIAGGSSLPFFDELYWAEKGNGAYCNGQKIHVTSETELLKTLVAYGIDGHQEQPQLTYDEVIVLGEIILNIRNLRSSGSAFDPMMVARGSYGASLVKTSKIWDNVAIHIILEEAGAIYTDYYGASMDYSKPLTKVDQNYTYCTAAAALHQQLQVIIHS